MQGMAQHPCRARKRTLVPWVLGCKILHKTFFLKWFSRKTLLVPWEPSKSLWQSHHYLAVARAQPNHKLLALTSLPFSAPSSFQEPLHPSSVLVSQVSHHNMYHIRFHPSPSTPNNPVERNSYEPILKKETMSLAPDPRKQRSHHRTFH